MRQIMPLDASFIAKAVFNNEVAAVLNTGVPSEFFVRLVSTELFLSAQLIFSNNTTAKVKKNRLSVKYTGCQCLTGCRHYTMLRYLQLQLPNKLLIGVSCQQLFLRFGAILACCHNSTCCDI